MSMMQNNDSDNCSDLGLVTTQASVPVKLHCAEVVAPSSKVCLFACLHQQIKSQPTSHPS